MSQLPNFNSGKTSKRKTDADTAESHAETAGPDDRAVRQRTDLAESQGAVARSTAESAAAAASSSPSSSVPPSRVFSLLRLAVVARQLVMQGLDLISLAQLASTCKQMRGEALDKEAGKFIHDSHVSVPGLIDKHHPAHASPLYRKHARIVLRIPSPYNADSLIHKTALFSWVVAFTAGDCLQWTDKQMLQLLSLPCMQHATELILPDSSQWIDSPLVQTALLGLPRLKTFHLPVGPATKILSGAVALASKLSTVNVKLLSEQCRNGALRALRQAPTLATLAFNFCDLYSPLPRDLPWCLPPTLTDLSLLNVDVPRDISRPLVKALFSRTPVLSSVYLRSASIEPILCGLLDAGESALPSLRSVGFGDVTPVDFSVGNARPLRAIFRRFVHRFPEVSVCIEVAWKRSGRSRRSCVLCRRVMQDGRQSRCIGWARESEVRGFHTRRMMTLGAPWRIWKSLRWPKISN